MKDTDLIKVDVAELLRSRAPGLSRWLPRFIVRGLERFICQEQINEVLTATAGLRDAEFCDATLKCLGVSYTAEGLDRLPPPQSRRVTFVCNHPLGGLDGICLIHFLHSIYGPGARFIVNDLLMALKPLHGSFVPINKHGSQSRMAASAVDAAFASDDPVFVFPAGLCSRKGPGGIIRDLRWNKMFVNKSAENGRTVIPLRFHGENSKFFYNFAKIRAKSGLKFNIEMLCLPRELFLACGKQFRISILDPIGPELLTPGSKAAACADKIREKVYSK